MSGVNTFQGYCTSNDLLIMHNTYLLRTRVHAPDRKILRTLELTVSSRWQKTNDEVCLKQPPTGINNNPLYNPEEEVVQVFFPRSKRSSKAATQDVVASSGRVLNV